MNSKEKRDRIIREVIKPLMKKEGYKCKSLTWYKELEDSFLIMHMKNGRFNNEYTGFKFQLLFSVTQTKELSGSIDSEWINNQMCDVSESAFLPFERTLTPFRTFGGYWIDGYRNGKPTDYPIEDILMHIQEDFETYILPELRTIHSINDFNETKRSKGIL